MPNQKKPPTGSEQSVDRRGKPRGNAATTDWETIALKRVERHVESLSAEPTERDNAQNPGWEEAAILALRRRMRQLKS